jgi:ABC-type transporter Mla subunit MlaD
MERFTHRYINQVTGAFVLLALLISVAVVYLAGHEHHWFEGTIAFGLLLPEEGSYGLKPGAAVMVLGAAAGEITDIDITPDDRMMARMMVRQDFARFIGTDSHATLKKTLGLAGDAFVNISGRPGQPLESGALIEAVVDRAVMDLLQETLEQVRGELLPAIRSIRLAAESHVRLAAIIEPLVLRTLESLQSIASKVDKGSGLVNRALVDKGMADDVSGAIDQGNIMLEEISAVARDLQAAVAQIGRSAPDTLHRANATLEDIQKVSENLIHVTALVAATIENVNKQVMSFSGVIIQTQATLREIQRLTEAAQQHWLIRGYVEDDAPSARIAPKEVLVTP